MDVMRRLFNGLLRQCSGLFSISLLGCLFAFHAITPDEPVKAPQAAPFHSLKAIRAEIARLKKEHKKSKSKDEIEREREGKREEKDEDETLDYFEALEAYLSVRAYPYDVVDWDALKAGVEHRDRMASGVHIQAAQWEFLGPRNCSSPSQWAFGPGKISGRVACAAFDPVNAQKFYITTSGGGAWKTIDGGITWIPMGDGWGTLNTSSISVDPTNGNNIFVGTGDWDGWGGYSQGIMRSTDGGTNWTKIGSAQFGNNAIRRILIDPENGQIVTVVAGRGSAGNGQVWRSTDGGNTWAAVVTAAGYWCDIVCSAADGSGNRTYYAAAGGSGAQVWRSFDRGASWSKLTVPMRSGASAYDTADLATSPTSPGTVYLLGTGNRKVWKSTDQGGTWSDITNTALASADWGQSWYDFYITCSTNGASDVLYVGLIDIIQSWNGGTSWRSFMNGYTGGDLAHVDEHNMIVDPNNPNHLMMCCDGGVYNVTVNGSGAGAFTSLNTTLGVTEFYYGDFHPTDGTRMIGGAQDNGSPASLGNLGAWRSVTGGDGGASLINQTNPSIQYTTYQYFGGGGAIGFNRTSNTWGNSSWIQANSGSDRVAWMGPITMAATSSSTLYLGTNYLWKYVDSPSAWTPRLGGQQLSSSSTVAAIGVTPANASVIYTGSGDGQLWVTRTGGTTWTQINTGTVSLPNRAYLAVSVKADNANDVLVGLSGSGASHLWRCADTSAIPRTWINVSGSGSTGLPDSSLNAIARDPADPAGTWYVGTDIGVFRTTNAGSTWENATQPLGLPNVQISTLAVRNGYLYVATYGRGMWRLNLTDPGGGNTTLTGLALNPTAVVGPNPSTGTVTISSPAPLGGLNVSLVSSNPSVAAVPSSVTVAEGSTTATFTVTTTVVTTQTVATITASLNSSTATADLTVNPNGLTNITLNPVAVVGGNNSQGTVSISTPAPAGGSVIQLTSSNTAVAQVPATVTVPAGLMSTTFTIITTPTPSDAISIIKATVGTSTVQTQLTVNAPSIASFSLATNTVVGGNPVQGTITLNGKAPSGGSTISLASSETSVATVPATATVLANATTVSFTVTTKVVQQDSGVTITGTYHGVQRLADLAVTAQKLAQITMTPNPVVGGNTLQGKVTLGGPAVGSVVVQLSESSPLVSMPTSVTVLAGQTSATFTVTTLSVNATTFVEVFATYGGSSKQATLTLTPLQLASFNLSSNAVFERQTVTGTVTLNGAALAGGAVVTLTNSNPNAATVPTSVTFAQGQSTKTFTITTKSVLTTQLTSITATRGSVSLYQSLSVTPISLQSIQLNLSSVTGGTSVSGVVRIVAPAPVGGYVVNLASSYPSVAKVPASVTIPQGGTSATFTVTTVPTTQTYFVTITASHGTSNVSAQLQVLPPEVKTFTLSTYSTRGGNNVTGTVTLTGRAPTGGMLVNVTANPNLAHPATTVRVAAGSTSVSFVINTSTVTSITAVYITARTLNVPKTVKLTLNP
jgi:hypothetical protein